MGASSGLACPTHGGGRNGGKLISYFPDAYDEDRPSNKRAAFIAAYLAMIELNHTIVPAHDKVASAQFFARIFGLSYEGEWGHFAPVRVNDALTLDFANSRGFKSHHLAFKVSEEEFDAIVGRIREEDLPYGSGPRSLEDRKLNHRGGGRGVYFKDPNGHVLELLTVG